MRTLAEIVRSPGNLWMTLGDTFCLWTEDISGTGQKLVAGSVGVRVTPNKATHKGQIGLISRHTRPGAEKRDTQQLERPTDRQTLGSCARPDT